jgi:hypothetical protein
MTYSLNEADDNFSLFGNKLVIYKFQSSFLQSDVEILKHIMTIFLGGENLLTSRLYMSFMIVFDTLKCVYSQLYFFYPF